MKLTFLFSLLILIFTFEHAYASCCIDPSYGSSSCSDQCSSGTNSCTTSGSVCCYDPTKKESSCISNDLTNLP